MKARGALRGTIAAILIALGFAATGLSIAIPASVAAEDAAAGTVLVVDGHIDGGKAIALDLAALKALPPTQVKTMTPWTDGENLYDGVRLGELLTRLGADGNTVIAAAIDDYQSQIPMEEIRDYDVIIAYAMNGKPLPRDDKGPLWIIYPYSDHSALQKDLYFSRSVWQLNRLTVQ